jgi:site-specific recombinase XerD
VVPLSWTLPITCSAKETTMDLNIERMGQDLALANYAKRTQKGYLQVAIELSNRFSRPVGELGQQELRIFVGEVLARGRSASWVVGKLAPLAFLYRKTLGRPEVVAFISYPKKHRPLPTVLSMGEVGALIQAIQVPVYQAIVMVMYGAGLRISEALALEVGDVDGARGVLRVRHGKGNKAREAKLSRSLYEWLRQFWKRERPALPYLFASPKTGKPPLAETIREAIALAAKQAWIHKHVTPHVLRHSFATHLLEQGTDIRVVSALLGHASISTTAQYGRVTEKLVRQTPSPIDLLPQKRW